MKSEHHSTKHHLVKGLLVLLFGIGGFVFWSLTTKIDGAVVASGQVTVEVKRQAVQHPDGGLVTDLHVKDGAAVEAGAPLLTLDGTELSMQQAVLQRKVVETRARIERLFAEIKEADGIDFSGTLHSMGENIEDMQRILQNERLLFEARRTIIQQTRAQLKEQQARTQSVISGLTRQLKATRKQLRLINEDLQAHESLRAQNFTSKTQLSALRREAAEHEGELGQLEAGIAEAQNTIAGYEIEWLREKAAFQEEAQSQLQELQLHGAELRENLELVKTKVGRLVLRAPMTGRVLALSANTIGGVIPAGAEIASIVPNTVPLVVTVRIDPLQIDRVSVGQYVRVSFPNFNMTTTPEIEGRVKTVSADTVLDSVSGQSFFSAEIDLTETGKQSIAELEVLPGMLVDAFIRTDERTPVSFLLKPIADYWRYSMREK